MLERIRKAQKDEGFTLIELLIVIVILGILAAIVVFAIGSTRKDSVASSCKTDFKSVELSAEAVNTKTGKYPTSTSIDETTSSNPLVSGGVSGNGALLKTYPGGDNYRLKYVGVSAGDSFTIHVQKPSGASFADVGTSPTTTAGCDNL